MVLNADLKKNSLLYVQDVYKSYGERLILDDIDLAVTKGAFCSVVGPSGCGKSTLLRLILGQERATSGNIFIDGKPVGFADTTRGIVYQKYSLYPHLSVLDNILIGKRLSVGYRAVSSEYAMYKEKAMSYLKRVRMEDAINKYPYELSGGMQQRVAIIQALIMAPKILLMDEPFGALDPGTREDMQLFLLELWEEEAMTIFFVTHDMEEAIFLGTRLLVLSQYFTDDRSAESQRGARIVGDYGLPSGATSTVAKKSTEFKDLIEEVRNKGFSKQYLQHVRDFNLKHKDSFRTLRKEEDSRLP
jgi:NitT/TauT family transport system ATP-binding protein